MSQAELSPEQVAELKQAFEMFDRDQGGSINTKELGCTMRAMGMNPTEAEILDLLNEVTLALGAGTVVNVMCAAVYR